MSAPSKRLIAVLLLLALAASAADDGTARVVRNGGSVLSGPTLDKGGVRLKGNREPAVPYSLIGAIALEGQWLMRCALFPLERIGWHRPNAGPLREPWGPHDRVLTPFP